MKSWTRPLVPRLPGNGPVPRIHDAVSDGIVAATPAAGSPAGLYVCGITPYDAAHIGHAATYLAYDTLIRLWLDAGFSVTYVQNTTDVDDPLLERAARDGVDWRELAAEQTELFRTDMTALGLVPPDHFIAVTDEVAPIAGAVADLLERGIGYRVDEDVYFDSAAASEACPWQLGDESGLDRPTMLEYSAERGGDPDRAGKRDPLDPLLWRARREGEPFWPSPVGEGRPGWHIECSVIARDYLTTPITVTGGGSDLLFPHHEFSGGHTAAMTGEPLAGLYSHAGLVAYRGEKMSKSLGNLVFVSGLRAEGVDPRAIRLAILAQHYRTDWEWTDAVLAEAVERLTHWISWAATAPKPLTTPEPSATLEPITALDPAAAPSDFLLALRSALNDDLDTPAAITVIDDAIHSGAPATPDALDAIHALLGIPLRA